MLMAMARDIRVIIIKLADRLHNMRTLGALRPERNVELLVKHSKFMHLLLIVWVCIIFSLNLKTLDLQRFIQQDSVF